MYNYRDDSDAEDGDEEFVASPSDDNNDEDIVMLKFYKKTSQESIEERLGRKG